MNLEPRFFEDYAVGEERRSLGRTITDADLVLHAGQTGDFYPHHMDAEFARTTSYGQRIAHGTLTFAIGVGLTGSVINPHSMSYGYDHLRFPAPVFVGDTIRTTVSVVGLEDYPKRPTQGLVRERCATENQRGETVMVCDHLLLVTRRDEGEVTTSESCA